MPLTYVPTKEVKEEVVPVKEKKSGWSKFWDVLKNIGSIAMKVLPMILAKHPGVKEHTISLGSSSGTKTIRLPISGGISSAYESSVRPTTAPEIRTENGITHLIHSSYVGTVKCLRDGHPVLRGQAMYTVDLTPQITAFCSRMASYQRFRFRNIAFTFIPAVTTEQAARVMGYFEEDVDNQIPTGQGDTTIEAASSLASACITTVWTPHTFVYSFHENAWFYTSQNGVEPRTNKQGIFTIVAASNFDETFQSPVADLTCTYDVEFSDPMLYSDPTQGLSVTVSAANNDCTANLPFGSEVVACNILDLNGQSSTADMAVYEVPNRLVCKYSKSYMDGIDTVVGSTFRLPKGYYVYVFKFDGDITVNVEHPVLFHGGYRPLSYPYTMNYRDSLHWAWVEHTQETTHAWSMWGYFYSDGWAPTGSLSITLATINQDAKAAVTFVALGGAFPYSNPFTSGLTSMQKEIDQIKGLVNKPKSLTTELSFDADKGKEKDVKAVKNTAALKR